MICTICGAELHVVNGDGDEAVAIEHPEGAILVVPRERVVVVTCGPLGHSARVEPTADYWMPPWWTAGPVR